MTRNEILNEIREDLTNLYNCANEDSVKEVIRTILNKDIVDYCKCPNCGHKFDPEKNMKHSFKILPKPITK